jgi:peroxiredoxin Q/BCP
MTASYKHRVIHVTFGLFALCVAAFNALAEEGVVELAIGSPAPEFSLGDQHGKKHSLADYRGQWVVLYFYPKDDTPGCTTEACQLRDDYRGLTKLGAEILGVSVDNAESHAAFSKKHSLPFPLLADNAGQVARQYNALWGVWPLRFAKRHTFIIDPKGNIAKIYRKVEPESHSRELIADLQGLQ